MISYVIRNSEYLFKMYLDVYCILKTYKLSMFKDILFFTLLILNKYLLYLAKKLKMYSGYSRTLRAKKTDKKLVIKEENK